MNGPINRFSCIVAFGCWSNGAAHGGDVLVYATNPKTIESEWVHVLAVPLFKQKRLFLFKEYISTGFSPRMEATPPEEFSRNPDFAKLREDERWTSTIVVNAESGRYR